MVSRLPKLSTSCCVNMPLCYICKKGLGKPVGEVAALDAWLRAEGLVKPIRLGDKQEIKTTGTNKKKQIIKCKRSTPLKEKDKIYTFFLLIF